MLKRLIAFITYILSPKRHHLNPHYMLTDIDKEECFKGYYGVKQLSAGGHLSYIRFAKCGRRELVLRYPSGKKTIVAPVLGFNFQDACRQYFDDTSLIFTTTKSDGSLVSYEFDFHKETITKLPFETTGKLGYLQYLSIDTALYWYFGSEYAISHQEIPFNQHRSALTVYDKSYSILFSKTYLQLQIEFSIDEEFFLQHFFDGPGHYAIIFLRKKSSPSTMLLLFDKVSFNLKMIHSCNNASHLCWLNATTVFIYGLNGSKKYCTMNVENGDYIERDRSSILEFSDGHPSLVNGDIITDTYSTLFGRNYLYKMQISSGQIERIGAFHSPWNFRFKRRCDLHPVYDPKSKSIFIDTISDRKRAIKRIRLHEG